MIMSSEVNENKPDGKPPGLSAKIDKKRKRQAEEPKRGKTGATSQGNKSSEGPSKKKQRSGKNKKPHPKETPPDINKPAREHAVDESIGKMDGRLLADHFAQKARKLNKELTAVEVDDLCVSGWFSYLVLFWSTVLTFQIPCSWIPRLLTRRDPWISFPRS